MTFAANAFGKKLYNFWTSPETAEYLEAMADTLESGVSLFIAKRGVGTWGHPKLAVFFARWLDVKFGVWCDAMIDDILKGRAQLTITDPENSELLKLREDFMETANALIKADRQLTEVREALAVTMSENVQLKAKQEAETALTASEVLTRLGISGPRPVYGPSERPHERAARWRNALQTRKVAPATRGTLTDIPIHISRSATCSAF